MNLIRLERHQHPRPPHHELRQKSVFDSGCRNIGQVGNLYVDDDRNLQFLDVCMSGFLGFGKKHHLVPVEAIDEESAGTVTLKVDQQSVEREPQRWPTRRPGQTRSYSGPPTSTTAWEQYFNRELRRTPLLRTRVNKATKKGRDCLASSPFTNALLKARCEWPSLRKPPPPG